MKYITLFTLILIFTINLSGQENIKTRRKINYHVLTYETFKVLKEDKTIKHGKYKRLRYNTDELLEKGNYNHGGKSGIWEYYFQKGDEIELEQKFDFDNDSLIYNKDEKIIEYNCYKDGKWETLLLKSQPIHIGGRMNLYHKIIDNVKIPFELTGKKITGNVVLSLKIDTTGHISNIKTVMSLSYEYDS